MHSPPLPSCILHLLRNGKVANKQRCPDLTDDPLLCGSFCVWLSNKSGELQWLSGRFLNAKWDAMELTEMRKAIVEKDMLVARMVVS